MEQKPTLKDRAFAHLEQYYIPARSIEDADFRMTSLELYEKLQIQFPSPDYSHADIVNYLYEKEYIFSEIHVMDLEWLMKRNME